MAVDSTGDAFDGRTVFCPESSDEGAELVTDDSAAVDFEAKEKGEVEEAVASPTELSESAFAPIVDGAVTEG